MQVITTQIKAIKERNMLEVRRTEIERVIERKKLGLRGEELHLTSKYYDQKFIQALLSGTCLISS